MQILGQYLKLVIATPCLLISDTNFVLHQKRRLLGMKQPDEGTDRHRCISFTLLKKLIPQTRYEGAWSHCGMIDTPRQLNPIHNPQLYFTKVFSVFLLSVPEST
jgi:hypothetical protein